MMLWVGCSTHDVHSVPLDSFPSAGLGFLMPGATSKAEALDRLGYPTRDYFDRSILTYALARDPKRGLIPERRVTSWRNAPFLGWGNAEYSLVLVFDAKDLLQAASLVKVR